MRLGITRDHRFPVVLACLFSIMIATGCSGSSGSDDDASSSDTQTTDSGGQ